MRGLGKVQNHELDVIGTTMEKYISFTVKQHVDNTWVHLRFIDSLQFMGASLEKLVLNLNPSQFTILKENIQGDISLLLRKGVYPYEYITSFTKFDEPQLPPISAFYSSLTDEHITPEEYAHAQAVWRAFNVKNLGDYHDLYVKSDVLQLADVFQNFRSLCQSYYDIDCAHLMTAPGLAWQACLKMTQQPLELLTDIDMHLFIERGIRGGVSVITKRWAAANNKYLENHDPGKPSSFIMYLDANNLYGWAMSQPLPYSGFQWVAPHNVTKEWLFYGCASTQIVFFKSLRAKHPGNKNIRSETRNQRFCDKPSNIENKWLRH